jgi:hypothetical protein
MSFYVIPYFCYRYFIMHWKQIGVLHSILNFVFTILLTVPFEHECRLLLSSRLTSICAVHSKLVVECLKVPYQLPRPKFFLIFVGVTALEVPDKLS